MPNDGGKRRITASELNNLRERKRAERRALEDWDVLLTAALELEDHELATAKARQIRTEEEAATEQRLAANAKSVADSDAATAAHIAENAGKIAASDDAVKAAQLRQLHAEEQAQQAETWLADAEAKRRAFRASIG